MDVFDLVAKLTLDTSEYDESIDSSESKASNFASKMRSGLGTAGKYGAAAIGAVTAAGVAAVGTFISQTESLAEYGDNIDKMSQKLGMSAEAYQEWDAIMQHSGASIDSMTSAMKTMSNAAENGNEAFAQLGITEEQIASLSQEELFSEVITGLQNMEAGTERTYLASQLLGRGATELGALLNTSAEDTEAMRQRVHELGGVMSDEAVASAAAYQDSLQDMQTAMSGLKNGIVSEFLPSVTQVMDGLTALFTGDSGGVQMITDGINDLVTNILDALPNIVDSGMQIINSLVEVLIENIPQIIEIGTQIIIELATAILGALPDLLAKAPEIIGQLVTALVNALPNLLTAATQIISSLVEGIVGAIPQLVPAAVDIVIALVNALIENVTLLVDAAIQIIVALTDAILENLPTLIEQAPEIISKLVSALIEAVPQLAEAAVQIISSLVQFLAENFPQIITAGGYIVTSLITGITNLITNLLTAGKDMINQVWEGIKSLDPAQWGRDLISNFIDGLKSAWESLKGGITDIAQGIKDFLGFSEPKEGPLSDFHTYAPDMMQLYAEGIRDNAHLVEDQLNKSLNFDNEFGINATGTVGGGYGENNVTINVYGAEGQDESKIAENIADILRNQVLSRGAVYA